MAPAAVCRSPTPRRSSTASASWSSSSSSRAASSGCLGASVDCSRGAAPRHPQRQCESLHIVINHGGAQPVSTGHHTKLRAVGAARLLGLLAPCGSGGSGNTSTTANAGQVKGGPGIDVANKTINLGVLTPLSGPVAVIGKPLTNGQVAYFNAINDSGGVRGWKVNVTEGDDQYNPQQHVQFFNEIADQVAMFAQSLGSPTTLAIQSSADSKGVVVGAATQSSSWVTDKVMAVIGTPYAIDDANGIDSIHNQLGKKTAKIGAIYQNDEYGADGLRGLDAAKSAYSYTDVGRSPYAATDTDFTSQVLAMKSAGAEYVFLVATPSPAGKIIGTAAAWGDSNVPGMAQFLADTTKYGGGQIPDYYYMYGYGLAKVEAAILKKAIANGDLSRAGILNAKLNLGNVDLGGLLPAVNYTPPPPPGPPKPTLSV